MDPVWIISELTVVVDPVMSLPPSLADQLPVLNHFLGDFDYPTKCAKGAKRHQKKTLKRVQFISFASVEFISPTEQQTALFFCVLCNDWPFHVFVGIGASKWGDSMTQNDVGVVENLLHLQRAVWTAAHVVAYKAQVKLLLTKKKQMDTLSEPRLLIYWFIYFQLRWRRVKLSTI